MRLTTKAIAAVSIAAAAVVATAGAGFAAELARIHNPLDGCTYSVWGPDVTVQTLPNTDVDVEGGFGETVSCP